MPELSPEAQEVSDMFDDLKRKTDIYYALRAARIAAEQALAVSCTRNPEPHTLAECLSAEHERSEGA